jgi:hypothetical protein
VPAVVAKRFGKVMSGGLAIPATDAAESKARSGSVDAGNKGGRGSTDVPLGGDGAAEGHAGIGAYGEIT